MRRAMRSPARYGARWRWSLACRTNCRPGRWCGSGAPRSRPIRNRKRCVPAPKRLGKTCFWPETGRQPPCRRPSKAPFVRANARPRSPPGTMTDTADRTPAKDPLDRRIEAAAAALRAAQRADGHWVFELEADVTIPAEYVLLTHYLGEQPNLELERKIAVYVRSRQQADGGWPLFYNGAFDISASMKAYFALKMIGDDPAAPHMRKAREAIRAHGGAAEVNVFSRFLLCLYGILPWSAIPLMPVEITLLPRWFFFHLSKISYWGRTVLVPLLVLQALKPRARNKRGVRIDELFLEPPEQTKRHAKAPHQNRLWYEVFCAVDVTLKLAEPLFPRATRKRAIDKAAAFVRAR